MVDQVLTESEEGTIPPNSDSAFLKWMIAAEAVSAVGQVVRDHPRQHGFSKRRLINQIAPETSRSG